MAAGLALAGLGGCQHGAPAGVLVPPVRPEPNAQSSGNNMFATASVLQGYAAGILVRHDAGRPIKVAGNPLHPASLGATDPIAQADLLGFYDPDRASGLEHRGEPEAWQNLQRALATQRAQWSQTHGEGLRILTGTVTSPTLARQISGLQQRYPAMRWHQWEPVSRDAVRAGTMIAYGRPADVVPHIDAADIVVAFDSDLISSAPGHVRFARDLASRRNPTRTAMSRIYTIEPTPTLMGVAADHRVIAATDEMARAMSIMGDMVLRGAPAPSGSPPWVINAVEDMKAHRGRAFIHVGPHRPAGGGRRCHQLPGI
jgi:molybdopterin-containing oxidoreductase family iron-sulfur binding subunit